MSSLFAKDFRETDAVRIGHREIQQAAGSRQRTAVAPDGEVIR